VKTDPPPRGIGHPGARERGAAAVEFALVVGLLLTIVFGIVEFGVYYSDRMVVDNAAREGVRAASLNQTQSTVVAATQNALSALPGYSAAGITVTCVSSSGGSCSLATTGASGGQATVSVRYTHSWLTPLFTGSTVITVSSQMRIE